MSDEAETRAVLGLRRARSNVTSSGVAVRAADPGPVLTASEIASFSFCPAAWHLQRCGAARNSASILNLEQGTRAHRRIATRATRVRRLERLERVMLLFIIALLTGVLLQILIIGGVLRL